MNPPKQSSKFTFSHWLPPLWLPVSLLVFAGGCRDTGKSVVIECLGVVDDDSCEEGETGGVADDATDEADTDETGETGDDEAMIEPCTLVGDGHDRTVHQCNGSFSARIQFRTAEGNCGETLGDPRWCEEFHEFGIDFDPYEMPAVMACCDPEIASEDDVLDNCASDVLEQICRSIPARLDMLITSGAIPKIGRGHAKELTKWLNRNQQDCFDHLKPDTYDESGVLEPKSWLVNNGDDAKWWLLQNFTIHFEGATITDASLPDDPADHLACSDIYFNNSEVFEDEVPVSPGTNRITQMLESEGDAVVTGRLERTVTGNATLALRDTCVAPRCSSLNFTIGEGGNLTLEDLAIYADGPAILGDGEVRVEVQNAALRLYGVSHGTMQEVGPAGTFVIPPDAALFVISGDSGFAVDTRLARNATPLLVHRTGEGWVLDAFTVEHVPEAGEIWRLMLPSTTWTSETKPNSK